MNNTIFPKDLLLLIFSNLDFYDLAACRRVCQRWKRAIDDKAIIPELIKKGTWPPQLHVEKAKITNAWLLARNNGLIAAQMKEGKYAKLFVGLPFAGKPVILKSRYGKIFVASQEGFITIFDANSLRPLMSSKVADSANRICLMEATPDFLYVGLIVPNYRSEANANTETLEVRCFLLNKLEKLLLPQTSVKIELSQMDISSHSYDDLMIHPGFNSYLIMKVGHMNQFFLWHHSGIPLYGINHSVYATSICFHQNFLYLIEYKKRSKTQILKIFDLSRMPEQELCVFSQVIEKPQDFCHFRYMEVKNHFLTIYSAFYLYHFKLEENGLPKSGELIKFNKQFYSTYGHPYEANGSNKMALPSYMGTHFKVLNRKLFSFDAKTHSYYVQFHSLSVNNSRANKLDFANQKVLILNSLSKGFFVLEPIEALSNRRVHLLPSIEWRSESSLFCYLSTYRASLVKLTKLVAITALCLFCSIRFYPHGLATLPPCVAVWFVTIMDKKGSNVFQKIKKLILLMISIPINYWLPSLTLPYNWLRTGINDYNKWRLQRLASERTQAAELLPYKEKINKDLSHICPISGNPIRYPVKLKEVLYERAYISELIILSDHQPNKLSDLQFQSDLHQKIENQLQDLKSRS